MTGTKWLKQDTEETEKLTKKFARGGHLSWVNWFT